MKKVIMGTLTAFSLLSSVLTANAQPINEGTVQTGNNIKFNAPVVTLPKTTGAYQVGTTTFDWLDTSRSELLTTDPKDYRELMVQAWYPIDRGKGNKMEQYIPATANGIKKMADSVGFGNQFVDVNQVNTQVYKNGRLSSKNNKYPVVIFSHGLGEGNWNYQWLTRELASHGYVVFSVEHTGFSSGTEFMNGRFVPITPKFLTGIPTLKEFDDAINQIWVKDLQFVIGQVETLNQTDNKFNFKNRLDLNKMAAVGHSMGGAAAARALQVETKFKSAIDIDGSLMGLTETGSMTKPFAIISNEFNSKVFKGEVEQPLPPGLDEKTVQDIKNSYKVFSSRYNQAVSGPAYDITIAGGATHVSFTDMPLLKPYLAGTPYANILPTGTNPENIYNLSNRVILAFLEKTLKGNNNTILDRKGLITPDLTIVQ